MRKSPQIDMMKGFGILFVVAGHSGSCLTSFYYTFHMGLMFTISGWLLSGKADEAPLIYLRKRIQGVLIPYAVFFGISIAYAELTAALDSGFFSLTGNHLKAFVFGGTYLSQYTVNLPLWYLYLYFFTSIIYYFLLHLNDLMKLLTAVALIFVTVPFQKILPDRPLFFVNILPVGVVYMLLGYALKKLIGERGNIPLGIVTLYIGWYVSQYYGGGTDVAHITSVSYYVASFCTIIGIYLLVFEMREKKMLEYLGTHSLYILGIHSLVGNGAIKLSEFITAAFLIENPCIKNLLFALVTIVLSCGLADIYLQIRAYLSNESRRRFSEAEK